MSMTVDERVVEMRFDNKHFESNVAKSMSTLDKLKQKLNLSGASKGLEEIDAASKKVNMSGLGGAVDTVKAKFSALDVVAVTALANITNQAVNAGKRMVSALTIDPIMSGFREYETQINSVQTILANTSSKGTTIDDVTAALDELNKYADLTIYNFTEMTRNIGTFTAAGIDLETSVSAIQGIANLAAVSGSTSQQASVAMYQLSQALASGTVKLMDWNSVVNAGMGGEVFQNALKETSRLLGTGADAAIEASGSFRESLHKGWLTAEVLTETLKKFTTTGANEYVAEYTGLSVDAVEAALANAKAQYGEANAIEEASKALAEKSGKNKDEIKSVLEMAQTATNAATKVKTFSQLWDVMKEAAQSGWAKTWQIIIGDFEEAKALLTPLSDFFTNIINKMSDWRNKLLESALGKSFSNLTEKINGMLTPAAKAAETVTKVSGAIADLGDIVDRVIRGEFGNGEDRFNALTEAGRNYYEIQNKVNETLGCGFRYSEDQIASQNKLLGKQKEAADSVSDATEATSESQEETVKLTDAQKDQIKTLIKLSDAELKAKGYTDEQIEAFRELRSTAEKLGIPLDDFIDNLDEINGRWLLINSFKNVGQALIKVFKAIGGAWRRIFDPVQSDQIFNIIAAIHKFTASLIPTDRQAALLTKTFKGLFAILDIIKTIVGGGIRIAFKVLTAVLNTFDLNILDVTAKIGDALVAFRDWLLEGNALAKGFNWLISKIPVLVEKFKEWFNVFKQTPAVQKLVDAIKAIGEAFNKLTSGEISLSEFAVSLGRNLAKALKSLPGIALQIGKDFIAGFQNGIGDSVSGIIDKIKTFCINFVNAFKEALGVQSPSWKAYDTAVDFFQGFINGAKKVIGKVIDVLKKIGEQIVKVFKSLWDFITDESGNIEWGKIFAGGMIVAMLLIIKKLVNAFDILAGGLQGINNILYNAGNALKSFSKVLDGIAWDLKAKALLKMAISIGILVAAILVLTQIDDIGKLWNAVGVIAVLALILVGLAVAMSKLSDASISLTKEGLKVDNIVSSLIQIGITIALLALTVKMIGDMEPEKAERGFKGLAGIAIGLIVFAAAMGGISRYSNNINDAGKMMKKIAIAMLLMVLVCKLVGNLSAEQMLKGAAFATAFAIFAIAIAKVANSAGDNVSKVGGMVIKLSIAMLLMISVCKLAGKLSAEEMLKGAAFVAGFVIFVAALVKVTKIGDEQKLAELSGLVISISFSLLLLVGVCKLIGMLSVEEMFKGAAFVAGFVVLLKVLVSVLKIGEKEQIAKVTGTILAMSTAIGILAVISILLSFMDLTSLAKGITAVSILSAMMALMVRGLKDAKDVKRSLIAMTVAIVLMVGAVVALSFIDGADVAGAIVAMNSLMLCFAVMIKITEKAKNTKQMVRTLYAMVGVIVVLAGIIALLSLLDPQKVIPVALSLSSLLLAFAASIKIMNEVKLSKTVTKNLQLMILVMLEIAAILSAMSFLPNPINMIPSAVAIGILLNALATSMLIMSKAKGNYKMTFVQLQSMALVMLEIAAILSIMSLLNVEASISSAIAIGILMNLMATACLIVSKIPSAAAIDGALGLAAFIGIMAAVVAVAGAISLIPGVDKLLAGGGEVLGLIGLAIGKFVGGIVAGIAGGIFSILPQLGIALSGFAIGAQPFINIVSGLDASVIAGAGYLTGAILALSVAGFISGVMKILSLGQSSLAKLGLELYIFGTYAKAFFDTIKGIDSTAVEAVTNTANMILALTVSEFLSTLTEKFGGSVDFSSIGQNLKTFGKAVVDFSDTISGKIDSDAVKAASDAGALLAELNKSLPRSGGLMQDIIGEQDFEKFAIACRAFAKCILDINEILRQEGFEVESEKLEQLAIAGSHFSELNDSLPRSGGIAQDFAGEKDLAAFGVACRAFAKCILDINEILRQEGFEVESKKLEQLATAGSHFSELNDSLPRSGGIAQDFAGEKDLAAFGVACRAFAKCILDINEVLSQEGFAIESEKIGQLIAAGNKFSDMNNAIPKQGGIAQTFAGEKDLAAFGIACKAFIEAMLTATSSMNGATIDADALDSIIAMGGKMNEFQSTLPSVGGVVEWFAGRKDLEAFGKGIQAFAIGMQELSQCGTINLGTLNSLFNVGGKMNEFQSTLPSVGGVVEWFAGRSDLEAFGKGIQAFADGMLKLQQCEGLDIEKIQDVIDAGGKIGELQNSLEGSVGGFVSWWNGQQENLGTFGTSIGLFADGMLKLQQCEGFDESAIATIAAAGESLNTLQGKLEGTVGGVVSWWNGQQENLGTFGTSIGLFADGMIKLQKCTITRDTITGIEMAAYRLKALSESFEEFDSGDFDDFTSYITDFAEVLSEFSTKATEIDIASIGTAIATANRLKTFISQLADLDTSGVSNFEEVENVGDQMKSYAGKVADIDAELISSSITSAYRLKNLISGLVGLDTSGVNNFNPDSIATSIKTYANAISGVNVGYVLNSIIAAERLKKFISSLAEINTSGVSSFKNAINQLATISIANVVKAFSGASSKLMASGATMINGLVKGMSSRLHVVTETITNLLTAMITSISSKISLFQKAGISIARKVVDGAKTQKDAMKSAGKNLGSGLVNGIKAKWDAAYNAGYTLGQKAVQGEKDGQQSESPSKLTTKAGKWLGEGLIIGMERMGRSVYNAGKDMGGNAVDATRSAMTTILEALNSDVDAQPTIRPVIDLTDVKTGASAISGMLSKTQTLGVRTNLNAINTAINNKLQNGSNDDIISAINKLGEGLDANRGDTYNFGDITYDDGSNVSEAVQTLVRAARIGRRV